MATTHTTRSRVLVTVSAIALALSAVFVGVSVVERTEAAWTDAEWVRGQFRGTQWNVVGSVADGSGTPHQWHEFDSPGEGTMSFSASTPTVLAPGEKFYAPYTLALEDGHNPVGATIGVTESVGTGDATLLASLTWGARSLGSGANCDASHFDLAGSASENRIVETGTPANSVNPNGTSLVLTPDNTASSNPRTLCFEVAVAEQHGADPSTTPFGTGPAEIRWRFDATS